MPILRLGWAANLLKTQNFRIHQRAYVPEGLPDSVWSAHSMSDALICGKRYQLFNVVDDFNREALDIEVELKALESVGEGESVSSLVSLFTWRMLFRFARPECAWQLAWLLSYNFYRRREVLKPARLPINRMWVREVHFEVPKLTARS